jgi:hypothetical protein
VFLPEQPGQNNARVVPPAHRGVLNLKTWQVYGWSDVQTLALPPNTSPGDPRRSTIQASIIADEALESRNQNGWTQGLFARVATYWFEYPPSDKYYSDWRLKRGRNEIWMRKTAAGTYEAELRFLTASGQIQFVRRLGVQRFDHNGVIPPATARFLWIAGDEDVWVACEDGCCRVSTLID